MVTKKHKVFVSYHHERDQDYKREFERKCKDKIVSWSVEIGDIDPDLKTETIRQKIRDEYLKESTVTVVLIGNKTWQRKHVDWEISSSIRQTKNNPRSGLLGIILPTYKRPNPGKYTIRTVPPRLYKNVECGYSEIYSWMDDPDKIQDVTHKAFLRKDNNEPDNSYPMFKKNRTSDRWD